MDGGRVLLAKTPGHVSVLMALWAIVYKVLMVLKIVRHVERVII